MNHPVQPVRSRWSKSDIALLILFLILGLLSCLTVYNTSLHILDSDASSELVLAHHLNETGHIISSDWYYSTELRALNTQLIFAPLFSVFSDWRKVRFFGALILQGILLLSFWYLCKAASLKRRSYLLGGSLLLLPTSVAYGRIVLYHSYYVPHIAIGFGLVGLLLAFWKDHEQKRHWGWKGWHLLLLLCLSFASGIGGVRQVAITHVPLLFVLGILCLNNFLTAQPLECNQKTFLGIAVAFLACIAFGLGYLVNQKLSQSILFYDYSKTMMVLQIADHINNSIFALLHGFGMRRNIPLFSLLGFLSLMGIVAAAIVLLRSFSLMRRVAGMPTGIRILYLFFPCAIITCFFTFFTFSTANHPTLYIIPNFSWVIPFISAWASAETEACDEREAKLQPLLLAFVCTSMICNGLSNHLYFNDPQNKTFQQPYEGLSFQDVARVQSTEPLRAYLQDHGYNIGYCTFWEGNLLSEMSSGQLTVIPITYSEPDQSWMYYHFLYAKQNHSIEPEKAFLCIRREDLPNLVESPLFSVCELLWHNEQMLCFGLTDPLAVKTYLDEADLLNSAET